MFHFEYRLFVSLCIFLRIWHCGTHSVLNSVPIASLLCRGNASGINGKLFFDETCFLKQSSYFYVSSVDLIQRTVWKI